MVYILGRDSSLGKDYCEDVTVTNVICNRAYRNGISVISVDGLTIEGCILKNTDGTSPRAGIDFEPNRNYEKLKNIVMRDCQIDNNNVYGIIISLHSFNSGFPDDISFFAEDCTVTGDGNGLGISIQYMNDNVSYGGLIEFSNVTVSNVGYGIRLKDKSSRGAFVSFNNCEITDSVDDGASPINIVVNNVIDINYPGGVEFIDCIVNSSVDDPAIHCPIYDTNDITLNDVHGDVYVNDTYSGTRTDLLYDWGDATLNSSTVDLIVHPDSNPNCNAHNITDDLTYTAEHVCYGTVQSAIDATATGTGDEIAVYPGTHTENVDFNGESITLRSTDPYDWAVVAATIIDADNFGTGVEFNQSEGSSSILTGLTIKNGKVGKHNILCNGSGVSPTISNCIIEGSYADGISSVNSSSPDIKNNFIYGNTNAGVFSASSGGSIINNTIVDNKYGVYVPPVFSSPTIKNCILWDNSTADLQFNATATYSCYSGGTGTNIGADPNFVDAGNDDYHLTEVSPCINVGSGDSYHDIYDIDGDLRVMVGTVDMGADEFRRVHNVDQDSWYVYIQEAIVEALTGDEIIAYEDRYYENIDFIGKGISISSTDPDDPNVVKATIIDADGWGSVVTFENGEPTSTVIEGFTITGGNASNGGGILVKQSNADVRKCIIKGNTATSGGGINARGVTSGTVIFSKCVIDNNDATSGGGVLITSYGVVVTLNDCLVINNTAVYGGGVYRSSYCSVTVTNCTISGNAATSSGGGIYGDTSGGTIIKNSILWDNTASTDNEISGNASVSYSDVQGGYSGDNINSDPNFVGSGDDPYSLGSSSPCIDASDGDSATDSDILGLSRVDDSGTTNTGIGDPNYVDMGAYEYQP